MKKLLLLIVTVTSFYGVSAFGSDLVDLSRIREIESSNNPNAVSYRGAKYGRGLYQISEICLDDYNRFAGHVFTFYPEDLFDPKVNEMIAKWYLTKRIPAMLRHYNKEVTVDSVLWAYNAGIGRVIKGVMPAETKEYIRKYHDRP